ncbi:hypothetical protein KW790_01180 [Candidatus Parcubacteria bacterium]|nr:hypothetical protein [Candidatus Parcubacteria bacterium]
MESNKESHIVISATIFLMVVAIWYWGFYSSKVPNLPGIRQTPTPRSDVKVTQSAVGNTGALNIPSGFPEDVPLDADAVTESYKASYTNKNVIQYSISFTSSRSLAAVWQTYKDFLVKSGFSVDPNMTDNKTKTRVGGQKTSDVLTVVLSPVAGKTYVQLSFLDR